MRKIAGIICFVLMMACLMALFEGTQTIAFLIGVVVFGFVAFLNLEKEKWDAFKDNLQRKKLEATYCVFKKDHIYFPKGYYFNQGCLRNKKELPYSIINEIRTNTHPASALINNNELIFLSGADKFYYAEIAKANNIPLTSPVELWSLISEEFLDTEFDEASKEKTLEELEIQGVNREEVAAIRKKLHNRMMLLTFLSWEYEYYGQWDVLKQLWPLTKEKYWWTMEIALRKKN